MHDCKCTTSSRKSQHYNNYEVCNDGFMFMAFYSEYIVFQETVIISALIIISRKS